ncbi:MAG TPA: hypothetical protein PKW90_09375, partial [Myxococcota bacterium]|nr:hypothetical protein [Myxococcota bacterium]
MTWQEVYEKTPELSGQKPMTARAKAATLSQRLMLMSLIDSLALTTLRAQGFSSRFYATSGGEVHLMEADGQGSGPPILMLHGLVACHLFCPSDFSVWFRARHAHRDARCLAPPPAPKASAETRRARAGNART